MRGRNLSSASGITSVKGIAVGHYTDAQHGTGCTVVMCEGGAVGGVDVRGSSPGTRETDLLRPTFAAPVVHAILLSGGSTFGLDAASGVMRYLEEKGVGIRFGGHTIPLVPAAILFDLSMIDGKTRPGPQEGYAASVSASSGPVAQGSVGAGTGTTVAKSRGREYAVKGGIGTASVTLNGGITVGAIVAVNAIGGVFDIDSGAMIAGPRSEKGMSDPLAAYLGDGYNLPVSDPLSNTTIGVVATDAALTKEQTNKLASVAHDGLAIAVRPAHLTSDGDTMFALATGQQKERIAFDRLCAATTVTVARAIASAVRNATGLGGVPSINELG